MVATPMIAFALIAGVIGFVVLSVVKSVLVRLISALLMITTVSGIIILAVSHAL